MNNHAGSTQPTGSMFSQIKLHEVATGGVVSEA